eukprot:gene4276-6595_t
MNSSQRQPSQMDRETRQSCLSLSDSSSSVYGIHVRVEPAIPLSVISTIRGAETPGSASEEIWKAIVDYINDLDSTDLTFYKEEDEIQVISSIVQQDNTNFNDEVHTALVESDFDDDLQDELSDATDSDCDLAADNIIGLAVRNCDDDDNDDLSMISNTSNVTAHSEISTVSSVSVATSTRDDDTSQIVEIIIQSSENNRRFTRSQIDRELLRRDPESFLLHVAEVFLEATHYMLASSILHMLCGDNPIVLVICLCDVHDIMSSLRNVPLLVRVIKIVMIEVVRLFTLGHPNIEHTIQRYLQETLGPISQHLQQTLNVLSRKIRNTRETTSSMNPPS